MKTLNLKILGTPHSKQSARFRMQKGRAGNTFIRSYQKKEVIDNERNIQYDVKSQLPTGFVPYSSEIGVKVLFVFPSLKGFSKAKMKELEDGKTMYKTTKPDLVDNLMKGLFDAMNGIVFVDDALVCKAETMKVYGMVPRIEVEIYEIN